MENGNYQHYPFTVYTYDEVDSTNAVARRAVISCGDMYDMTVHVAGSQTEGRGRNGRTWLNTDDAVMMSIVHTAKLPAARLPMLNLAAAAAVRKAVMKLTGNAFELSVKWPNDVVTSRGLEKLCGILSEVVAVNGKKYAVIGIGLDLNAGSMPGDLLQPATSVFLECGRRFRVLDAVDAILDEYLVQYELLKLDPEAFLNCFGEYCISVGRHVAVHSGDTVRYGIGDRLAKDGRLIVRFEDGALEEVSAGDVSIKNKSALDAELIKKLMPKREPKGNKGSNGRAGLIVGSCDMPGAALMCAKACVRAGAGLTKALVPDGIRAAFASVPEVMLEREENADSFIDWASAVGVGCGMGVSERTAKLLEKVLLSKKPCVIDADALNTMAQRPELMKLLHSNAVLTPHPGEMARLCGCATEEVVKRFSETAIAFAAEHGCCVLLKSASSIIVSPNGNVRYNDSGNSGLAKGGSGDVLAGLVTSMLAQGAKPFDAASIGSFLLGSSAEKALGLLRERFIEAGDIIDIVASELNARSAEG